MFLGDFLLLLGRVSLGRGKRFSFGLFFRVGFNVRRGWGVLGLGLGLGGGGSGGSVGGWGVGNVALY